MNGNGSNVSGKKCCVSNYYHVLEAIVENFPLIMMSDLVLPETESDCDVKRHRRHSHSGGEHKIEEEVFMQSLGCFSGDH